MRQPASLECQSQKNRSSFRILDLERKWHLSPASGFEGSQSSKKVLWPRVSGSGASGSCQSEVWTVKLSLAVCTCEVLGSLTPGC